MNPAPGAAQEPAALPWWSRLHGALMPDYNRKATAYWWLMVVLGSVTLGRSVLDVIGDSPLAWLQIAVGMAIAMGAGFFPVRVPRSRNSFAAGEIFVFLLLLIRG